jgi:His-Xaa-Ser system protein HxsD
MENHGQPNLHRDGDTGTTIAGVTIATTPYVPFGRDGSRVVIEIDTSIYSRDAVTRASYKFTDQCHILLDSHPTRSGHLLAYLDPKVATTNLQTLYGEFANELLDQQLRERLEAQFGDVRSLIVAQAFAEGNLLDRDRDEGDYVADPRNIGGPQR